MRILLIATNRHNRWMSKDEVRPLPIGLAYVAAYIDPQRHPLRVLDLMFAQDYLAETEKVVQEFPAGAGGPVYSESGQRQLR